MTVVRTPRERDGVSDLVRVSIDVARIRAAFSREKPPVLDDEWDADAYVADRAAAYLAALEQCACKAGVVVDAPDEAGHDSPTGVDVACPPSTADRVRVVASRLDGASLEDRIAAVALALRPVFADAGAWRRFLLPAYFARHRAWRAAVGNPIQH